MGSFNIMKHEEAKDLLPGYTLGTLDDEELASLEAHLGSGCSECETALKELSELASRLAYAAPQVEPDRDLKERVMANMGESRPNTKAYSLLRRRLEWLFAGVAAVVVVGLSITAVKLRQENVRLEQRLLEAEDITAVLSSAGVQFASLKGVGPNEQAFGKVVLDPEQGVAVVYMYQLPQTPQGMEYQLWVMREDRPTSAGVFRVTEDGSAVLKLSDLAVTGRIASFQVTIESEGGQLEPTGMMYLTGPVVR